jgi:uncharacterized protein YdeI (YjbR/CyaY-like superfamily)
MAIIITKTFYPKNKSEWRKWLLKNHNSEKEIWVIYFKKATGKPTLSYEDAVEEALCFGWIDGVEKSLDTERFAQRFTPRAKVSSWSKTNVARYKKLLKEGLMTDAGTKAFEAKVQEYSQKLSKVGVAWHEKHKIPKNPSLEERLAWHQEHKKHCGCRPIPKSLEKYFS